MSVFLANEQADYRVDELALTCLARLVMDAEGVEESEISLLLVDRAVMTDLNERYMGEDRPTDVLAFPIDGPRRRPGRPRGRRGRAGSPPTAWATATTRTPWTTRRTIDAPWLLGDIVLCPSYAAEQATRNGQSLAAELELLAVHGILHLCGFDHAEPAEEQAMKARTNELLARWRAGELL